MIGVTHPRRGNRRHDFFLPGSQAFIMLSLPLISHTRLHPLWYIIVTISIVIILLNSIASINIITMIMSVIIDAIMIVVGSSVWGIFNCKPQHPNSKKASQKPNPTSHDQVISLSP